MMQYFIDNFFIIVLVLGFVILFLNNLKIKSKNSKMLKILLLEVTAITIFNALEYYCSTFESFNYGRLIFSFLCYSLRPFIIIAFISLLTDNKVIKYFYSLALINTLIYSTCFFSDVAFGFNSANKFIRGPLGFSNHILCSIYLALLLFLIIKKHYRQVWNKTAMLLYVAIISTIAAITDLVANTNLFDQTILVCTLFYYLFLYIENNKIDELTNVFNRKTFYDDMEHKNNITAIMSIDMNNLKQINDNQGHLAGDKALVTLANILLKSERDKARSYRLGGDEFAILCFDLDQEEVIELVDKIKRGMNKTKYSCSIGYEMCNSTSDKHAVYRKADKKMYKEKENYYLSNNLERRHS